MPRLIRFVIANVAAGTVLCWAVLAVLVMIDFQGWRQLLAASEAPGLAAATVAFTVGPFIGVCYLATGLMMMPEEE